MLLAKQMQLGLKQSDHDTYVNQMFTINFIGKQMFINDDLVFEFKTNRVEDIYATGETVTGFLADCICDTWDKQRTQSVNIPRIKIQGLYLKLQNS